MNRFLKINTPWLSLLGLAITIVVLAFIFRPKSPHYLVGSKEALSIMINDQKMEVGINDIAGKQLIDIRSAEKYAKGHSANAMNIPIRQLLDNESLRLFKDLSEEGKLVVLYGSDELQVTAPLFLLQQLGYKNIKVFKGGLASNNEFKESEIAATEISVIDVSSLHGNTEQQNITVNAPEKKTGETVIPKRKGASAGGGC